MNQITDEVINDTYYKELIIDIDQKLNIRDESILKNLFANFPEDEFTCDISEDSLTVFLNSVDLEFLKNTISVIKSDHSANGMSNILDSIVTNIESIKSYGLKGSKRIYIGYNKERKVKNRKVKEINRNKYYYATDHNFSTVNNNIPIDFENKIICGDSLDVLKKLPDNCIDLVFTSPPYNFGLEYESNEDAHHWEKYFDQLFRIFDECIRVLKFGGRIIVNTQPLFSDYIPSHHMISNYFMSKKLIWKGEILWEKNNYNCKYTAWGSWKSPSNPYLKYTWEFIEIFAKGTLKKEGDRHNADISADEFKKWVVSKWSIAPERNMKDYKHPSMFPEELATRVLKLFSFQNDVILDPFNGVGTTTFVAKITGRKYVGIDISKEYCKKAEIRLSSTLF
ncbi:MAG: site-specific DNA-methyltransferase [Candidatus Sumerlaeota bacterium]|nr:site-specific DNA-methyltransferase [Candidatus Sumerlaeota bacterium]